MCPDRTSTAASPRSGSGVRSAIKEGAGWQRSHSRIAKALSGVLLGVVTGFASTPAASQGYPSRTVRIVVPLSPGSQTDLLARMLAQRMAEGWNQPVIVENHPGGAGQIAGKLLVNAAPDGYTLMLHSDGYAVSAALYGTRLPYDTLRDFARVSLVATSPSVLVVSPRLNVKSVAELIALAKTKPGGLSFGSAGIGGGIHFTGEMFKLATGIDAVHVPFKGMPEAITEDDDRAPRLHVLVAAAGMALPPGRQTAGDRGGIAAARAGAPGRTDSGSRGRSGFGLRALVWRLCSCQDACVDRAADQQGTGAKRFSLPEVKDRLLAQGVVPRGSTAEEFDAFVRAEIAKLSEVVKTTGIKVD